MSLSCPDQRLLEPQRRDRHHRMRSGRLAAVHVGPFAFGRSVDGYRRCALGRMRARLERRLAGRVEGGLERCESFWRLARLARPRRRAPRSPEAAPTARIASARRPAPIRSADCARRRAYGRNRLRAGESQRGGRPPRAWSRGSPRHRHGRTRARRPSSARTRSCGAATAGCWSTCSLRRWFPRARRRASGLITVRCRAAMSRPARSPRRRRRTLPAWSTRTSSCAVRTAGCGCVASRPRAGRGRTRG